LNIRERWRRGWLVRPGIERFQREFCRPGAGHEAAAQRAAETQKCKTIEYKS
jgi:hypothetical protein